MKFRFSAVSAMILFFSCATNTPQSVQPSVQPSIQFKKAESISEIEGIWKNDKIEIEYPILSGGKRFLRISQNPKDQTDEFFARAESAKIPKEQIWQARHALNADFPRADSNGSQEGSRIFQKDGRIFAQKSILVSEIIAMQNLPIFEISENATVMRANGIFRVFSEIFEDKEITGEFKKQNNEILF